MVLSALSGLPLFGRGEHTHNEYEDYRQQQDLAIRQHSSQLEATVQRLLAQLEELSEVRDKEALELATLKRELRLRSDDQSTGPGSTSGSGSPQLPDENTQPHNVEGLGISPALSDDGFTKLDPSETELWEATQELSQSLEAQVEAHKKEVERYQLMKQDWSQEKAGLEKNIEQLKEQLFAMQDWQTPDQDEDSNLENVKETVSILQREKEELLKEKEESFQQIQALELKLREAEKENTELSGSMEELDSQHQAALNQILEVKNGVQQKYDSLNQEYLSLKIQYKELENHFKSELQTLSQKNLELIENNDGLKDKLSTLQKDYHALLIEKSDLQSADENLHSKVSSLCSEKEELQARLDSLQFDHESLQAKLDPVQSENSSLKTKMNALQSEYEDLKFEIQEMKLALDGRSDKHKITDQSTADQTSSEKYLLDQLQKIVNLDIPDEYMRNIPVRGESEKKDLENQLDLVAGLVKMTVDLKSKKEMLERKCVEVTRQLRDMNAQLGARDKKIAKLEEECIVLRENMESLLDGLNVAPDKGMLPSIPETPEAGEDENGECSDQQVQPQQERHQSQGQQRGDLELSRTITRLEHEVDILREARSNLEHETERLRAELGEVISRLRSSEAMIRNQDNLEREIGKWRDQNERLRQVQQDLENEKLSLKEEAEIARFGQDSLQAEVSEWKTIADTASQERENAIQAQEALITEIAELKAHIASSEVNRQELQNALNVKPLLEAEVEQLKTSVTALEASNLDFEQVSATVTALKNENHDLEKRIKVLMSKAPQEEEIQTLQERLAIVSAELEDRIKERDSLNVSLAESTEMAQRLLAEKDILQKEAESWQLQFENAVSSNKMRHESEGFDVEKILAENDSLQAQVKSLQMHYESIRKDFEDLSLLKSTLLIEVTQLKERLLERETECKEAEEELKRSSEGQRLLNNQLEEMSAAKHALELEVRNLNDQLQSLKLQSLGEEKTERTTLESMEKKMCTMLEEKEQILSVLAEKTRENGILRSENQKLLSAMSSKKDDSQAESQSNPLQSEQVAQFTEYVSSVQKEKDQLITALQAKHNESVQYHAEILRLNAVLNQMQQQIQQTSPEQQPSSQPPEPQKAQMPTDSSLASEDDIQALYQKLTALTNSLQQERAQNSYLQNEMQEQHEKEGMLTRELERLRAHLMEVGESNTAEALRLEDQVRDLQGKLSAAEERLRSVSTAHTSASILANQHVESLQGQSRLIVQQRDELQSKLNAAEDREQRNAAALRNLQAVLEQFQRDKERDLTSMTEKLREELNFSHKKQEELSTEMRLLKNQLAEAKEGLSAAARLGEQLDRKSETITGLKEQIIRLQEDLNQAKERVKNASQSVEGKVDKSLVKNLVVGLLTAPANTRSPALRVVASVLDFSQDERQRVGLEHGTSHNSEQSLSEAFVRFLESESRPQMQMRLLPELSPRPTSTSDGRKDSRASSSTAGDSPVRHSPLLSEVVLPTLTPLPVGRSSSSILKDVLSNDS